MLMILTSETTRSRSPHPTPNNLKEHPHILYSCSESQVTTRRWPTYRAETCSCSPSVLLDEIWLYSTVCVIHKNSLLLNQHNGDDAPQKDTFTIPLCLLTDSLCYCCDSNVSIASIGTLPSYREVKGYDMENSLLTAGCTSFPKPTTSHFKNSRWQKGDVKQVPY